MKLVQQGLLQPGKRRPQATPVAAAWTHTIQSVVNVPPQAVSSHSMVEAQAVLLDYKEDSDEESPFHETSRHIMRRSSPVGTCLDPLWQTTMWLEACGDSFGEEDIIWWLLVMPLTDGSTAATKELTKCLVSAWRWMGKVSVTPLCPPAPTMLNTGQFLEGHPREWDQHLGFWPMPTPCSMWLRLWRGEHGTPVGCILPRKSPCWSMPSLRRLKWS